MTDELKFAWAYLLLYGKLTNGKWCFYGGCWEDATGGVSWNRKQEQMEQIRNAVDTIGIDWEKTEVPIVTDESSFTDTFSDSIYERATLGTLYLKNGESFLIGSDDNEAASLADAARQLKAVDSDLVKLANLL